MPFADELIGPDAARTLLRTIRTAAPKADLCGCGFSTVGGANTTAIVVLARA